VITELEAMPEVTDAFLMVTRARVENSVVVRPYTESKT
jgi:hypothetical protein